MSRETSEYQMIEVLIICLTLTPQHVCCINRERRGIKSIEKGIIKG